MTFEERTRRQYADDHNLNARTELHRRFSTSAISWHRWVFDHFRLGEPGTDPARVSLLRFAREAGDTIQDLASNVA